MMSHAVPLGVTYGHYDTGAGRCIIEVAREADFLGRSERLEAASSFQPSVMVAVLDSVAVHAARQSLLGPAIISTCNKAAGRLFNAGVNQRACMGRAQK